VKKFTELIAYFQEISRFDDMKRYATQGKSLWQRNPAHCYNVGVIADYLIETLNLDLDYKKVRQMIDHHDQCELGWARDYEAIHTSIDANYDAEKKHLERKNIERLSKKFNNTKLKELWEEYEKCETKESKFVHAVDKIEAANHKLARGLQNEKNAEFSATYPNDYIKQCAELIPFWKEFQQHMATQYTKNGYEWKDEYNVDNEAANEKSNV
jgi:putative hydrolase of HD superfamily